MAPLSEFKIKYFVDYILRELGIVYTPEVYFQLEQRLEKVAQGLGLSQAEDVYDLAIREGITGNFKQLLLDISTNNETSFFRDPKVFSAIENYILPQIPKLHPQVFSYRIWCCASSFGQEPYSMAMLAHEFMLRNPQLPRIEIIATDISEQALKRCEEGKYSSLEMQRGLTAQRTVLYFDTDSEGNSVLKSDIKRLVTFKKLNLLDPMHHLGNFHLILCRYVLIYQDSERKKQILSRIEKCLHPEGFLILGASESALGLTPNLKQEMVDGGIFYQKIHTPI
jgi:chemotaxis protein methyltransferase CheR